ncbi:DNA polymerase zeta catalytic subunit [Thelohanellus kitauei]|uniref:DNA-directed DNA polymerase n=1 Tax=Thelohanellus kitauei TaxID=669202 RepID=A0A0C2J4J9_THEKT|nr:DNA polymerase zeta catalytic subunit [Thelohanellus kitauei]
MPCPELADAIVSTARKTLENTIKLIEQNNTWGARVIYGDTDSVFVLLPGRNRQQAFKIGREIAKVVSDSNPEPLKLKFEKVYFPCFLQTKKRYCGLAYENEEQKIPFFDSKGIETIRRDFCPLASKSLKKCLNVLFETKNVSLVKEKFQHIFMNVYSGKIKLNDFFQSRIYKGMNFHANTLNPIQELVKYDFAELPTS